MFCDHGLATTIVCNSSAKSPSRLFRKHSQSFDAELLPAGPNSIFGTGCGSSAERNYMNIDVVVQGNLERVRAILAAQRKELEQ
jgi:hypothetical protein